MSTIQKDIKIATQEEVVVFPDLPYETMPYAMESVGTSFPDKSYRMERRCSDVTVIEFVVKGSGFVETSYKSFQPVSGDSYLLRADEAHKYYANPDEPWEKIWINLRGSMIFPILNAYGLTHSMHLPGLDLSPFIKRIHEISNSSDLSSYEIMDRSFVVFLEMCQFICNHSSQSSSHRQIPANIARLKDYLDNHLSEHLQLEECSKITYLSVSQTIRKFRAAYGVTPYEYLNQRRISTAKLLLTNSTLSIEEIALLTGFPDRNYFSKYFKKRVGKSPSQFRKLQ